VNGSVEWTTRVQVWYCDWQYALPPLMQR